MDYKSLKVVELKEIAKARGLKGYSKLLKSDLIEFLKKADTGAPKGIVPKAKAPKAAVPKAKAPKAAPKSIISYFPSLLVSPPKSPELSKLEYKNIFQTTASLAFIYQISNKENRPYLSNGLVFPNIMFSYEDAIACSKSLDAPQWKIVDKYLEIFAKEFQTRFKLKVDTDFLYEILKKEVLEFQKGNITFLHSKNLKYLALDIISQLISGSYEGFKPKCLRKEDEVDKKALEIIKELFNLPHIKKSYSKDHEKEVRKRVISANISIFNNAFNEGESSIELFFLGSIMEPSALLDRIGLSPKLKKFVLDVMNEIVTLGKHLIVMYSIPIDKLSNYVYPAKPYGEIDKNQQDIYKNLKESLQDKPWKSKIVYNYLKQFRIVDLCYTKYAHKKGVKTYQITDIPVDKLEILVKKIDTNLSKEKDINDWFISYIDIAEKKKPKPVGSIRSLKSGKLLAPSDSSMISIDREIDKILSSPKSLSKSLSKSVPKSPLRSPAPKRILPSINLEEEVELIIRSSPPKRIAASRSVAPPIAAPDIVVHPVPAIDYDSKTVVQLRAIAKSKGLRRYSTLRKAELIEFLKKH